MDDFKKNLDMLCVNTDDQGINAAKKLIREAILANVALKRDLTFEEIGMISNNHYTTDIGVLLHSGFFERKMTQNESAKVSLEDQTVGLKPLTPENMDYLLDWVGTVSAERQSPHAAMLAIKQRELLNRIDLNLIGTRVLQCLASDALADTRVLGLHNLESTKASSAGKLVLDIESTSGYQDYVVLPYHVVASAKPKVEFDISTQKMLQGKKTSKSPRV